MHTDGREARGRHTRDALLEAARSLFARHGFAGASVRDVAAAAGANPALVRYHFGSKQGLYEQVIAEAMGALRDRIATAIAGAGGPREAIKHALDAYVDHLVADPEFPRLVQRGVLDRDPVVLRIADDHLRPLAGLIAPFAGMQAGATDFALTLFGAAVAPVLYAPLLDTLFGEDPLAPDAVARRRQHLAALVDAALPELP